MNPQIAAGLLARARTVLASGRAEMGERVAGSPVARYLDAARFEREVQLMRGHPQPVLAASDIAAPGSWWSGDVLGVPLLLVRDAAGALHASVNVCRHRGARVMAPGAGCGRERFACPYHAWTYGTDGSLLSIPKPEGFPGVSREGNGLRRLAIAECVGIIWVIPDTRRSETDIVAALGSFVQDLQAFGMDRHVGYAPRQIEQRCNWKLMVEGASEAYHFKLAHRDTIAPMFADNVQIVDEQDLHRRMYIVKERLREREADGDAPFDPRAFGNLLYFFFPSTVILVQPDHAQVTRMEPSAPGLTQVHDFALIPEPPETDKAKTHWERNVALYRATLGEDYALMESIQAGLASGANTALRFGRYEFALARFNEQLDAELEAQNPRARRSA